VSPAADKKKKRNWNNAVLIWQAVKKEERQKKRRTGPPRVEKRTRASKKGRGGGRGARRKGRDCREKNAGYDRKEGRRPLAKKGQTIARKETKWKYRGGGGKREAYLLEEVKKADRPPTLRRGKILGAQYHQKGKSLFSREKRKERNTFAYEEGETGEREKGTVPLHREERKEKGWAHYFDAESSPKGEREKKKGERGKSLFVPEKKGAQADP